MPQTKKLNSRGFGHLLIVLIIVVLVAVGGAGYLVYRHQHKAHASGYDWIGYAWGISVYACKTYVPAYGGVYSVKALFTKAANAPAYPVHLNTLRNGKPLSSSKGFSDFYTTSSFWANTVSGLSVNASAPLHDTVYFAVNGTWGAGGPGSWGKLVNPATISNCN